MGFKFKLKLNFLIAYGLFIKLIYSFNSNFIKFYEEKKEEKYAGSYPQKKTL